MIRHVALISLLLGAIACGGSTRRPPLEEVPIDSTPPQKESHETVAATATATASATPPPSVAAQAKELLQKGDSAGARALLEPRVADRSATPEEVTMLRGICKAKKDTACVAKLKGR